MIATLLAAAAGAASGLLIAPTIRRLPEPDPEPPPETSDPLAEPERDAAPPRPRKPVPDFSLWGMDSVERDKEPYPAMASARGLVAGSVIAGALLAGLIGWRLGADPALVVWLPMVPVLVAITVVDWRSGIARDRRGLHRCGHD